MPDREKVIRHIIAELCIARMCKKDFASVDIDMLSDALDLLKEQEAKSVKIVKNSQQTVNGLDWISVKDRLPDRQQPVLVYVPPYTDGDEEYIGYVGMAYHTSLGEGFWAGTDGAVYGAIGMIHEPTHWMPLPEPPKEGRCSGMNELKPCPFCGNRPKLYGKKIREIDGETMKVMPERTEWKVVTFCEMTCVLGRAFSAAYGINGDGGYKTPEAAIRAWNKRYEEGL